MNKITSNGELVLFLSLYKILKGANGVFCALQIEMSAAQLARPISKEQSERLSQEVFCYGKKGKLLR